MTQILRSLCAFLLFLAIYAVSLHAQESVAVEYGSHIDSAKNNTTIVLSDQEKDFLRQHAPIKVCIQQDVNHEVSNEFWRLFQRKLAFDFQIVDIGPQTSIRVQQMIDQHRCDIWPMINARMQLYNQLHFSKPYYAVDLVLVGKAWSKRIADLHSLKDGKIAVLPHYQIQSGLRQKYPHIEFIVVESVSDAMEAVRDNIVQAWLTNSVNFQLSKEKYLAFDLEQSGRLKDNFKLAFSVATLSTMPMMSSIVEKMLQASSERERSVAVARALNPELAEKMDALDSDKIHLSESERHFLKSHGPLKVCVTEFYTAKKMIKSPDKALWELFNTHLNAEYKFMSREVAAGLMINAFGSECDIWPRAVSKNTQDVTFSLSSAFYKSSYVMVTLDVYEDIVDIEAFLRENPVAVTGPWLKSALAAGPDAEKNIRVIADPLQGAAMLHRFEIEALVMPSMIFDLVKIISGERHLKIAASFADKKQYALSMAINNQYPQLLGIVDKLIEKTPTSEIIRLVTLEGIDSAADHNPLFLSQKEKQYLIDHETLTVCIQEIFSEQRKDLWTLIAKHLSIKSNFMPLKLGQPFPAKCDVVPVMSPVEAVNNRYSGTDVFIEDSYIVINSLASGYIGNLNELNSKRVAISKSSPLYGKIQPQYKGIEWVSVSSYQDALVLLRNNQADAYIVSEVAYELFKTDADFEGSKKAGDLPAEFLTQYSLGVSPRHKELVAIINKSLKQTSHKALYEIFPSRHLLINERVVLSIAQRHFLQDHGPLKICTATNTLTQDNSYWELLNKRLNVTYTIQKAKSLAQVLSDIQQGICDIHPGSAISPQRLPYLNFTRPFLIEPYLLIVKDKTPYLGGEQAFTGLSVAVIRHSAVSDNIGAFYPELAITPVDHMLQGLNLVHTGEVKAFISPASQLKLVSVASAMQGLKVGGQLSKVQHESAFAFALAKPELLLMLEDAVAMTPADEFNAVLRSYSVVTQDTFDYQLLWKITAAVILGLSMILIWNRYLARINQQLSVANDTTRQALDKVELLLNSSGEGFLSVKEDLLIEAQHSNECLTLFDRASIHDLDVSALVFAHCAESKAIFHKGVRQLFQTEDAIKQEFLLQLLPTRTAYADKTLKIVYHYRLGKLILIIKNITLEEQLKKQVEIERCSLQKIVYAIVNQAEVIKICSEFQLFTTQQALDIQFQKMKFQEAVDSCHRQIHTFKALFMQIHFLQLAVSLHQLETDLKRMMASSNEARCNIDTLCLEISRPHYLFSLENEKREIIDKLGNVFFSQKKIIHIDEEQLGDLLLQVNSLPATRAKDQLLTRLKALESVSLADDLQFHLDASFSYAERLGKRLHPPTVEGEDIHLGPDRYSSFIHSLVHIFRNAITHGIELPERREELNKPVEGHLTCHIRAEDNHCLITISDDGEGISIPESKGEVQEHPSTVPRILDENPAFELDEIAVALIFSQGFTTQKKVDIHSGRGTGLSAVIKELENIRGTVKVYSHKGVGSMFVFKFPY